MKGCQIAILILLALAALRGFWQDVHGVEAREPYGFSGCVITVLTSALMAWVYWKAGAFSELW